MNHLSPAELMDVVEGIASREALAHANTCEWCHRSVKDAEAGAEVVRRPAVPEPSPLFWAHLSRRIQVAAAEDGRAGRAWFPATWVLRPVVLSLSMALTVIVGAAIWTVQQPGVPARLAASADVSASRAVDPSNHVESLADDESWSLVSHLAGALSGEPGSGDAVTTPIGSADRAIPSLTEGERAELARLLRERLGES